MTTYDELRAMIGQREKPARPTIPLSVKEDLAFKDQSSKELGLCLHCKDMLRLRRDGVLGSVLIRETGSGGTYSKRCRGEGYTAPRADGHVLDPNHLTWAGRNHIQREADNEKSPDSGDIPPY